MGSDTEPVEVVDDFLAQHKAHTLHLVEQEGKITHVSCVTKDCGAEWDQYGPFREPEPARLCWGQRSDVVVCEGRTHADAMQAAAAWLREHHATPDAVNVGRSDDDMPTITLTVSYG